MRIGLLPLARATFDVEFAAEQLGAMIGLLDELTGGDWAVPPGADDETDIELVGAFELLFDAEAASAAIAGMEADGDIDLLLVLQATFTDAGAILEATRLQRDGRDVPIAIWAVPEPRLGGRLRLNSFCGLNLAVHALGRCGRNVGWLYAAPDSRVRPALRDLLAGRRDTTRCDGEVVEAEGGEAVVERLAGKRIARLGAHPDGFETCRYDADAMRRLTGVEIEEHGLDTLFDAARAVGDASAVRRQAESDIGSLDGVDAEQLERSLKLKVALDELRSQGRFDAFAIRCWPETFTEHGGAVCGAVAQMGEARAPCACEADVYGALTQLLLQDVADAPVFLVDLVDMDREDDTGVVWHCGQAPVSMASPDHPREATIHTNRKQPLLYQFPLKAGPVTFVRISQAWNRPRMVIGRGEMLARDKAFTGTSGTVRFARGVDATLDAMMDGALEHHVALAYGDHADALRAVAARLDLPVLEL